MDTLIAGTYSAIHFILDLFRFYQSFSSSWSAILLNSCHGVVINSRVSVWGWLSYERVLSKILLLPCHLDLPAFNVQVTAIVFLILKLGYLLMFSSTLTGIAALLNLRTCIPGWLPTCVGIKHIWKSLFVFYNEED